VPQLQLQEPAQPRARLRRRLLLAPRESQRHAAHADLERRPRVNRHPRLRAHLDAPRQPLPEGPRHLVALLPLLPRPRPGARRVLRHLRASLLLMLREPALHVVEFARRADLAPLLVDQTNPHAQMLRQGLLRPGRRVHADRKPLRDARRQRRRQGLAPIRQPVARRHRRGELLHRLGQGHEEPTRLLRQRRKVMLHLLLQMPGHRPIERDRSQPLRLRGGNVERHTVVVLPRPIRVGERQDAGADRQRGREGLLVHRDGRGIAQVLLLQHEETRILRPTLAHEGHQIRHGGDALLGRVAGAPGLQPVRVETIQRLVDVEEPGVARAGEQVLQLVEHLPVVRQKIERPGDRVVHQRLADEDLRRVRRVDLAVGNGAVLELEPVEARALLHHHAPRVLVPEGLAVRDLHQVAPEIKRPGRVQLGHRAGVEARGFHDLRRHDPLRRLRRGRLLGAPLTGLPWLLLAEAQRRAGEDRDAPVVRRLVAAVLLVAHGDVAQQTGQDAPMDRAVGGRAEGELLRRLVRRGHAVENRARPKITARLQHVEQLRVDVAPLADARVAEEVLAAESTQARLRKPLELVVKRLPDRQQREKIRVGMDEAPVRGVGLLPRVHRPLARILDREAGGDDQHLVQGLLLARLEDHAAHRRVDRQARELAAERREFAERQNGGGQRDRTRTRLVFPRPLTVCPLSLCRSRCRRRLQRAELLEQRVAGADRLRRRHVDEREALDIAEPEGLQAQDDVGQIGALDLGLGEARARVVILLRIQAHAHALRHAAGAALALVAARLGDLLDRQAPRARGRHVARDARQTGVDHVANARQGERGLGDVGRDDDLSPLRAGEDALLLRLREPSEKRDHLAVAMPPLEHLAAFADVPLGRHEHQNVAARIARAPLEDALHRLHRAVDVVQRLGLGLGLVALGRVAAQRVERSVDHLHRIGAPGDLHDRRVVEGLREGLGVDRGGGDDDAQLGSLETQVAQVAEEEVDIERTLVRLVQDDGVVGAQQRVALDLGKQHAVGHELHHRVARSAVVEADLAPHLAPPLDVQFLGHAAGNRKRGDAPRLRARDLPTRTRPGGETHLGNLRGLSRAGLAREDDHLVLAQQLDDFVRAGADRQLGRKFDAKPRALPPAFPPAAGRSGRVGRRLLVGKVFGIGHGARGRRKEKPKTARRRRRQRNRMKSIHLPARPPGVA